MQSAYTLPIKGNVRGYEIMGLFETVDIRAAFSRVDFDLGQEIGQMEIERAGLPNRGQELGDRGSPRRYGSCDQLHQCTGIRFGANLIARVREMSRLRIRRQDPILNASLKLKLLSTPIELPRHAEEAEPVHQKMRRHAGSC